MFKTKTFFGGGGCDGGGGYDQKGTLRSNGIIDIVLL